MRATSPENKIRNFQWKIRSEKPAAKKTTEPESIASDRKSKEFLWF